MKKRSLHTLVSLYLLILYAIVSMVLVHQVLYARTLSTLQNPTLERLQHLLSTATDTAKVNLLNIIAFQAKDYAPEQMRGYAEKALLLARSLRYTNGEVVALKNLGIASYTVGAYATALECYTKALRIADSTQNRREHANILNNIGIIQSETGNFESALKNFHESLSIHEQLNTTMGIAGVCNSIGDAYYRQHKYSPALQYYMRADSVRRSAVGNSSSVDIVALGRVHLFGEIDSQRGLALLHQGIEQAIIENNNLTLIDGLTNLARYYITIVHKPALSLSYLNKADSVAQSFHILMPRIEIYKLLAEAEKHSGNIAKALEIRERLTTLRDSLIFNRRGELLGGLEELHRYESERNQESIRILNRERDTLYQTILLTAVVIIGTTLIIGAIQYRKRLISERALAERSHDLDIANVALQETNTRLHRQTQQLHSINKALQQTNLEFEQANAMKIKILSVASHDLKNPLMNIRSLAEILQSSSEGENREFAEEIQSMSVRMLEMIGDLLDRAAMESGNVVLDIQEFSMSDMLRVATHQFTLMAQKKNQTLILNCEESITIAGDERKLRQVVDNLISNALKYFPLNTQVRIALHHNTDTTIRFEVQDEGPGLTEEDKAKAFGFFQKLSARPTGGESSHGVGLSSVKHIVDLHHGRVWVESIFGQGATFIVELPIKQPNS